jgi:hypothetical protein
VTAAAGARVVLAFEIEQASARVLAGYTLRAIMEWRDQNP